MLRAKTQSSAKTQRPLRIPASELFDGRFIDVLVKDCHQLRGFDNRERKGDCVISGVDRQVDSSAAMLDFKGNALGLKSVHL
jgi:hypothetical protein